MSHAIDVTFWIATRRQQEPGIPEEDIWSRPDDVMPEIVDEAARQGVHHMVTDLGVAYGGQSLALCEDLYELMEVFCTTGPAAVARGEAVERPVAGYFQPMQIRPAGQDHIELGVEDEGPLLRVPRVGLLDLVDCGERYLRFLDLVDQYGYDTRGFHRHLQSSIDEVRRLVPRPSNGASQR